MSYRVLIVDDSRLARMAVAKSLTALRAEWERIEASNADEALALVKANHIDVTLLDFNMPGRDGLDLAAELRDLHPEMPVAIISANHQTEIITRAGKIGATFLAKPLTEQALGVFLDEAEHRLKSAAL
jgi:YesN/AraC family two-component response regulator